jgi:hypothetical protein
MVTHLMFDIETLGKRSTSVVLSLACVAFTFEDDAPYSQYIADGFYVKFNPIEQLRMGRTVDQDTIDWWKKQPKKARKILKPSKNDVSMKKGLAMLREYINKSDYDWEIGYCWSRGNYFDFPIIEDLHDQFGAKLPFNTWKIRDVRTMIDVLTGDSRGKYELRGGIPKEFVAHHALHDAALDVMRMKEIFQSLREDWT